MKILSKDLLFSNKNKVISSDVSTALLSKNYKDLIFTGEKFWGVSASQTSGFFVYYSSDRETYTLDFNDANVKGNYGCLCPDFEDINVVCTFISDTPNNRVACYKGYNLIQYINSPTRVLKCIYVNGLYYLIGNVIGSGGRIHIGSDISSWQDPIQLTGTILDITYGNGIFIVITENTIYISSDGLNYTKYNAPFQYIRKVIYADGYFYIAGSSGLARSKNGIDWTTIFTVNDNYGFYSLGWGNKKLVALGYSGAFSTIDFKNYKNISNNRFSLTDDVQIAYGNEIFNFTDNNTLYYMSWGIE